MLLLQAVWDLELNLTQEIKKQKNRANNFVSGELARTVICDMQTRAQANSPSLVLHPYFFVFYFYHYYQ